MDWRPHLNADLPKKGRETRSRHRRRYAAHRLRFQAFPNTLYVDKYQAPRLIQAFSRTNRVLNDTKPHGHFDFRNQATVDLAIALLRRERRAGPQDLLDKAGRHREAQGSQDLVDTFMACRLTGKPTTSPTSRGTKPRAAFIKHRQACAPDLNSTNTRIDLSRRSKPSCPRTTRKAFRGQYLETAQRRARMRKPKGAARSKRKRHRGTRF
ncbi:MAG: hypothetical protein U0744_20445 [Gemmataceae bacterium]